MRYRAPTPGRGARALAHDCLWGGGGHGRLSLFMQLEVARLLQGWLISSDNEMYYAEKDIYAKVQSSTLNEELGQVRPCATRATAVARPGRQAVWLTRGL